MDNVNTGEMNKKSMYEFMERGFNQGDLSVVDEVTAPDGVDHQEPPGTDYRAHLKHVIQEMRTAFPDLHFEIHQALAEGDMVAFRSTMTGTFSGPFRGAPPTGRKVVVPHMHFLRMKDGKSVDLWHVWEITGMLRQMGLLPQPQQTQAQPAH